MPATMTSFASVLFLLFMLAASPALAQTADDYGNGATGGVYCPALSTTLQRGSRDATTGGQVSELQSFITDYYNLDDNLVAGGFFGKLTQKYVVQFQREQGLPSLGIAGSLTRAAIARACGAATNTTYNNQSPNGTPGTTNTSSNIKSSLLPDTIRIVLPASETSLAIGQRITISYNIGGNIVANDPAIVERKIVKAFTDVSVSSYIPVSVSGGTYTFDWTPSAAGTYQVLLSISHNNTIYPARSAVITVGNGNTSTNTNAAPSLSFSSVSSGNVIGSYNNLPANSQIRFVNTSTGQRYDGASLMVYAGGSGQISFAVPNDLPGGTYYLRATDYYNPNTVIAQSPSFQAGNNVQTNSVIINSFTATPATINAGQAVMFMWSSNLTQNDIAYYGGGCNIEGIANNTALYVTKAGFTGASGQITFVPPATGVYTLRCTSGAKDGSPIATRQITVTVGQPQTNPVVISSFTASQTTIASGQSVTFVWNSNLTNNDISYYGGACNIEGVGNNIALYVSQGSGSYGASGSITYTPAFTATYNLRCYSGAKDGSPSDSKQVTVNVN